MFETLDKIKVEKIESIATEAMHLPITHKFGEEIAVDDYKEYIIDLKFLFTQILCVCHAKGEHK